MTDTHRDTVMRLMVEVGTGCEKLQSDLVRDLTCQRIQVDEIWAFVGKKQRQITPEDNRRRVGKRDLPTATAFIADLNARLDNRIQLSSDALAAYIEAVELAFGANVDYGQVVRFYDAEPAGAGRYSPPNVVRAEKTRIVGEPVRKHISTSIIERQNLTMRMSMRRFTRLTNGFSKKIENHRAAVALHFAHYNFVRLHRTLRITPAMAARVSSRLWSLEELVERTSK